MNEDTCIYVKRNFYTLHLGNTPFFPIISSTAYNTGTEAAFCQCSVQIWVLQLNICEFKCDKITVGVKMSESSVKE